MMVVVRVWSKNQNAWQNSRLRNLAENFPGFQLVEHTPRNLRIDSQSAKGWIDEGAAPDGYAPEGPHPHATAHIILVVKKPK